MTAASASVFTSRDLGPAPERDVARDLAIRGLKVLPVLLLVGLAGWGVNGVASVALAVGLVIANFVVAAALLSWAARISLALLMGVALFGFVLRIGAIGLVLYLVRDAAWVAAVPLGFTLVLSHLGLLLWEARFVSLSLAHPGLKPGTQE
ncbi:MAG: ATP synthase subunit I [Acidimicrobiales bacterium]|nr:ATP synthase subunit I [Acidimicrobiales bacterium]